MVETFQVYPDAQWVWWLDMDAIIMSPTTSLQSHLLSHKVMAKKVLKNVEYEYDNRQKVGLSTPSRPDPMDIDLLISQDHNGLNCGSFLLRRSEWTQWLLDIWKDPLLVGANFLGQEQDALVRRL